MLLGSAEADAMVRFFLPLAQEIWIVMRLSKKMLTILATSPHFIPSHVRRWSGQRLLASMWERGSVRDFYVHIPDRYFPRIEEQTEKCNALTDVLVIREKAVKNGNEDVEGDCRWIKGRGGDWKISGCSCAR